ncbi:MAG: DUF5615 family PIN-like protein [Chloroflexi bacterium]|nr:DUF5615 family PIN-like protein [Chloroflexota bacterium]
MEDRSLRFYLDELMPVAIAEQLNRRGIDTITVRDLSLQGYPDAHHLQLAHELGRVLCTLDDDYFSLLSDNAAHSGIVFGSRKDRREIGAWVRFLTWMHQKYKREDMRNRVEYLRIIQV